MKNNIALLTLGLALLGAAGTVPAQDIIALSNLTAGTPVAQLSVMNSQWIGKEFTTGSGQTWNLDNIQLTANEQNNVTPLQLSLYSNVAGKPGISLVTFTGASPSSGSIYTALDFNAPANTMLQPNTTYWLVGSVQTGSSASYTVGSRAAGDTTYSGLSGWSYASGIVDSGNQGGTWNIYSGERNPMYNLEITSTPEPSTMALAALGGAGLLLFRRRK